MRDQDQIKDHCDEDEDQPHTTNESKPLETENKVNTDKEGIKSDNSEILKHPTGKDYELEADFLETASLDCSSLSGYVENALLASANNTLERNSSLGKSNVVEDSDSTDDGQKSNLCVQYVTYDFIAAKSVDGYSSDGSSECFNSNEDISDIRKSEREDFVNSLRQNTNSNNNNGTLERYCNSNICNSTDNLQEPRATFTKLIADKKSLSVDELAENSNKNTLVNLHSTKLSASDLVLEHREGCQYINQDENDHEDMTKAKTLFGLCLCQNADVTDDESATELDFRNCNLKQVPIEIFQFTNTLQQLQLDSNTLSELPKALFSCKKLDYLTVSDNDLANLPSGLAGLTSLTYLDISKNVIEDVPDCIRCCKSLEVLDASVNPIERLSEGFTQLVGLKELYLNDCFLEFLPASFGRLVHLAVLELRDNQLQILPKSIKRLTLLKRLDLGGNVFQEWPDVISQLLKLNELWLDGNELNGVPPDLGELTNLSYLDISRNFVESIPTRIGSLTELTDLLLCENHISQLPDSIGFLTKLTMIKCSMNQLTEIPDSVGKLQAIEELDLSHNKLESVPATLGNLKKMHTCLLDNNVLDAIPPEIGSCSSLKILQLSRNKLETIPSKIGDLSELRVLNICRNKLPHLPISVIKLAKLEALWVSSNQSKPNVPLHAEIAPNSKVRILTNILFPQNEEHNVGNKIDENGFVIDAADDNMNAPKKTRGITRVAFNLEPECNQESSDGEMNEENRHHAVEVSDNHITNGISSSEPSSLIVKMTPMDKKDDNEEEKPIHIKHHLHKHEEPLDDLELLHTKPHKLTRPSEPAHDTTRQDLLESKENIRLPKDNKPSLPLLPPNAISKAEGENSPDGETPQLPKMKTWSSRNNLPTAILPVPEATEIDVKGIDDRSIQFMDSDNEEYDTRTNRHSSNNNNKHVDLNKATVNEFSRDWKQEDEAILPPIEQENKPSNRNGDNEGPCTDWDSGVGNDVDSQESIPEGAEEHDDSSFPSSPASSTAQTGSITVSLTKSPTSSSTGHSPAIVSSTKPKISPKRLPVPSQSSFSPPNKKPASSVFENIKKFETYVNKENIQSKPVLNSSNKSQVRKHPEEKAIIRPNNHLANQSTKLSEPVKADNTEDDMIIQEKNSDEIMFNNDGNGDAFTFSKVDTKSNQDKKGKALPSTNKNDAPGNDESKHQHFRNRLERIMQQQRNVAMQASQAAQNISQSEMIMSYSRKSSLSAISSSEVAPDQNGLENITADLDHDSRSPVKKEPPVYERMKTRLSDKKPSQAPSSKIINRSRPGSAPATQLQRRGSSQRSSISALEGEDKRALNNDKNVNQRTRSKSIEQQLGQLLLTDSDDAQEELMRHHQARNHNHHRNDDKLRNTMLNNVTKMTVGGSRSSLVSPPPIKHNMYSKPRSSTSTNPTPPVSDWKYKLLQHIERKRQEKTEVDVYGRPSAKQSIGHIKSPPKTNTPHHQPPSHHNSHYSNHPGYENYNNYDPHQNRGMTKSVTAPMIGHSQSKPSQLPRSQSNSSSKQGYVKPPKHRTFTPGPEHSAAFNEGVVYPQVSRPKSAMEKYTPDADMVFYKPSNELPTYTDHLQKYKGRDQQQIIPRHLESEIKSPPQQRHNSGFPLRPTGSHDSLMENYSRYEKPASYYRDNPIRTTASHDSILDQVGQSTTTNYYDPYQEQHHMLPTKLQYHQQAQQQQYHQQHVVPHQQQALPQHHHKQSHQHSRKPPPQTHQLEYNPNHDHATYVNVGNYHQTPTHAKPPSYVQYKQYYNKPAPAEPPTYNAVPNYHNAMQRHHQRSYPVKEIQPQVVYREEESVISAFRPYNQQKSTRQPPMYKPPPPIDHARSRHHHRTPSNGMPVYGNYMEQQQQQQQNVRRQSPVHHQQMWEHENDYELITVSVRRNPTFGFHVMGGVGAGGNPYYANDEGVFITHVTPRGPADGKLQPGDKIMLVNGSKFVGISHTRAVDMLRTAGPSAVLVVERSLGKAV